MPTNAGLGSSQGILKAIETSQASKVRATEKTPRNSTFEKTERARLRGGGADSSSSTSISDSWEAGAPFQNFRSAVGFVRGKATMLGPSVFRATGGGFGADTISTSESFGETSIVGKLPRPLPAIV